MELDIYLPLEHLAFEYQGEQHYHDIFSMGPQWLHQQKDSEKKEVCNYSGITLIEIPYWWDFMKGSLAATIQEHRPDLISSIPYHRLISEEAPSINH